MEKCKKVCTDLKPVGEPDQYQNLAFSVSFADGTLGFFKCKEQNLFQVGQEAEFYIEPTQGKSGVTYNKILRVSNVEFDQAKKPSTASTSGSGGEEPKGATYQKSSDQVEQINRSASIRSACLLLAGTSNNTPDRVLEAAEMLNDYITFGITDKQPANVAAQLKKPATVSPDELPF